MLLRILESVSLLVSILSLTRDVFEDSLYPFFLKDLAWTSSLWVHENTLGTQIN
jgi:hypothetical protein